MKPFERLHYDPLREDLFSVIETLVEAEQTLFDMTGGEVDTVVGRDGKPYVLRRAQEELRSAEAETSAQSRLREQMLTLALSSMSDFAQIYDRAGRLLFVNQPLLNLWGMSLEEAVGKDCFELGYPKELAERLQAQLASVVETSQRVTDETPFTGSAGEEGYYEYILSPVFGLDRSVEFVVGTTRDITERKLYENRLHRQGAELQALFDLIPAMLCIKDTENRFVRVNQRLARTTGLTVEQIEGRSAAEIFPVEAEKYFADDLEVIRSGASKLEIVEALRTQEGEERWVQTDKIPFQDRDGAMIGLVVMAQDITERKRTETALIESEERLRLALDAAGNGMFDWEIDTNRLVWSSGHEKLWGYGPGEFDGKMETFTGRVHQEDLKGFNLVMQRSLESCEPFIHEFRIAWPDESIHWINIQGQTTFDPEGRPLRMRGLVKEITDRKVAEIGLLRLNEELEARVARRTFDLNLAKEEADRANKSKSEFLSRMSHELRTPLNAVMGYAQLLDMQYDDPNIAEATRSILKGGQHLLQLVNEVLDLSRIESGIFAISLEPVSVEEVLGDAIGMVQPLADRDGIRLVIDWAGCKNLYLEADRQRLVQVLVNLLGNGIKYNRPNGRVTVLCRAKSETSARIEVVDTGFGISPVDQKRLFEPFQRFGDHLVEGTGLGLALSERFMRLMGGRLGLSESSETGSTFFVDLPCSVSPDQNPESTTRLDSSPSSQVTCTGTVLYIEDNPTNLRLLEAVFAETPNLVLLTAPDGKLGFELAIQGQPDLILLDLHLPEQHGDQVLRRLKEEVTTRSIPVVMISADATPKQMQTLIAAGAVDYLTKPIELRRLFDVLGEYLPGPVLRD